MGLCAQN